jgi:peptidoglycan hydrolase CwlO-like protein
LLSVQGDKPAALAGSAQTEEERMTRKAQCVVEAIAFAGILTVVVGCDWWPPALQERIGQQEAQIKVLQAEKTGMQARLAELTKTAEDLKAQAAQAEQVNSELKSQVEQLKVSLAQAEAKTAKQKFPPGRR